MRNKENQNNNDQTSDIFDVGNVSVSTAVSEESATELNLFPDLILDDSNGNLTVVIKHDYYSADTDHGRELLSAFFDVIADEFSKVSRIFVIDSGVKLLDPDNKLHEAFMTLVNMDFSIIYCRESIDSFGIEFTKSDKNTLLSMHEIALELMSAPYLFTLN
ncbi:MAG: DsrE family protein [Clostridiales bacterium]|nr:DsrE family protein [Clostridiales bacterium]